MQPLESKKKLVWGGRKKEATQNERGLLGKKINHKAGWRFQTKPAVLSPKHEDLSAGEFAATSLPGIFLMQQDRHDEPTKNNPKLNMNIKIQAIFPNHIM